MNFQLFGNEKAPTLLLIPGLGVSYESRQAVLDGYKSVYTNKLESIFGNDIHFWYGTKEAFVAKPQAKHLLSLYPKAHVEIFEGMNHGQLLIDHPEEIVRRIIQIIQ